MNCLLCMYTQTLSGPIQEAATVKAGTAVCMDHEIFISDPNLTLFLHQMKKELRDQVVKK